MGQGHANARRHSRERTALLLATIVLASVACTRSPRASYPEVPSGESRAAPPAGTVAIGSFDFPESDLLAHVYGGALAANGFTVSYVAGIGPREVAFPALEQGLIDLLPEYAGSSLAYLRPGGPGGGDTIRAHARAVAEHGLRALEPARADDANALAVTPLLAGSLDLEEVSDLRRSGVGLTAGGPPECPSRPLCLPGYRRVYGLEFDRFEPFPSPSVTAAALRSRAIDVGVVFTTDGVIRSEGLVVLRDDLGLQPDERVVPVVRPDVLAGDGERLRMLIDAVSSHLTTRGLRALNEQVGVEGRPVEVVAAEWLDAQGLAGGTVA